MLTRLLRLLAFLTRWRPLQNPRPPGRGLLPRLGERPAPSSAAGVRWQSLQGAAALSPLLGERQNLPQPAPACPSLPPDAIRGTRSRGRDPGGLDPGFGRLRPNSVRGLPGTRPNSPKALARARLSYAQVSPRGCPAPWRPRGRPAVPARPQPSSPTRQKNPPKLSLASQFPPPGPPPQPRPAPPARRSYPRP